MVMSASAVARHATARIAAWAATSGRPRTRTPARKAKPESARRAADRQPIAPSRMRAATATQRSTTRFPRYRVTMHNLPTACCIRRRCAGSAARRTRSPTSRSWTSSRMPRAWIRSRFGAHSRTTRALDVDAAGELAALGAARAAAPRDGAGARRGVRVRYENTEAYVAAIADVASIARRAPCASTHRDRARLRPDRQSRRAAQSDRGQRDPGAEPRAQGSVTFDTRGVTSIDWRTYPILRFSDVPPVDIALIDRPHEPVLGAGEATTTSSRRRSERDLRRGRACVCATSVHARAPVLSALRAGG